MPPCMFEAVNANDAVTALDADTANDADITLLAPNGPNTFDPVTNEAVLAIDAVNANDAVTALDADTANDELIENDDVIALNAADDVPINTAAPGLELKGLR